jgi:hypothetical protein
MSEPVDLSALDGNALVARLAVVMQRALLDSYAGALAGTEAGRVQRADTEAVIAECSLRLLRSPEIERLRRLIRAVVDRGAYVALQTAGENECLYCTASEFSDPHTPDCPWPALVAEAEKS